MDDVGMDEQDFQARGNPLPVNFTPKWMQDKESFDMVEDAFQKSQSHSNGASFDMGGMVESLDEGNAQVGNHTTKQDWEIFQMGRKMRKVGVDLFEQDKKDRPWEFHPLKVQRLDPRAKLPSRAYQSNGFDLFCLEGQEIRQGEVVQFDTGLSMDLTGYLLWITPKSGLATKHGITTMAGLCDQDYRGRITVCLTKLTPGTHIFRDGDKIAQFILIRTETPEIQEVVELPETQRGNKGFGSSGF